MRRPGQVKERVLKIGDRMIGLGACVAPCSAGSLVVVASRLLCERSRCLRDWMKDEQVSSVVDWEDRPEEPKRAGQVYRRERLVRRASGLWARAASTRNLVIPVSVCSCLAACLSLGSGPQQG